VPRLGKLARLVGRGLERRVARRAAPDIVHATYYDPSPLYTPRAMPRARRVLTVYDMIHERYPQAFPAGDGTAAAKRRAVAEADHVLCISESTRRDLIDMLGVPEAKTSVTYLAATRPGAGAAPAGPAPVLPPYLLYVGDRRAYKNFCGLVQALGLSPALRELALVCFGGGPLGAAEWAQIDGAGLARDRVHALQGDDARLAQLYAGARCFVYPSLYEGFGIPPLEAMHCDCAVACSNTSSLPEVVGDAAESFDPHQPEAIAQALERVALSESRRQALVAAGRARAAQFSWARCAADTAAVYRRTLQETAHA
jgi:glycosyltransferase involved in cell wall biosynthesis